MLVPELSTQVPVRYNAALLANKFSDFRKSLALTVDLGRTFLATADFYGPAMLDTVTSQ
jgi:hypothetical protein